MQNGEWLHLDNHLEKLLETFSINISIPNNEEKYRESLGVALKSSPAPSGTRRLRDLPSLLAAPALAPVLATPRALVPDGRRRRSALSPAQPNNALGILKDVDEDDVVKTFITIRKHRPEKLCCNPIYYLSLHYLYSKLLMCCFKLSGL